MLNNGGGGDDSYGVGGGSEGGVVLLLLLLFLLPPFMCHSTITNSCAISELEFGEIIGLELVFRVEEDVRDSLTSYIPLKIFLSGISG